MNAQLNPINDHGIRAGTKQAILLEYLQGRTEATHSEITKALIANKQFTAHTDQRKVAKEVSDTLRHLNNNGFIEYEKSDKVYWRVKPTPETTEPTPPLTETQPEVIEEPASPEASITPDNYHKTLAEVAQELIQEAANEQDSVVRENQTTAELAEFNAHLEPENQGNSQRILESSQKQKKMNWVNGLGILCQTFTEEKYITPDGAEFYELEQAINHTVVKIRDPAFKEFLSVHRYLGLNGKAILELLNTWEDRRSEYLPQEVQ